MLSEGRKGQLFLGCPSPGQWELNHLLCSGESAGLRIKGQALLLPLPTLLSGVPMITTTAWALFSFLVKYSWYCEEAVSPKWSSRLPVGCIKLLREKWTIHTKNLRLLLSSPHCWASERPRSSFYGSFGNGTVPPPPALFLLFSWCSTQNTTAEHFSVVVTSLLRQTCKNF